MDKNLFITGTSYQLLSAISVCSTWFNEENIQNIIIFRYSKNKGIIISDSINIKNTLIIPVLESNYLVYLKKLLQENFKRFIFYQESDILNKYIAYKLKKKKTQICLGPDGAKPYGIFNKKHETLSVIKDTFYDYSYLYKNGIYLDKIFLSSNYRYGSFSLLDEIWLPFKNLFDKHRNKVRCEIVELPIITPDIISDLKYVTNFTEELNIPNGSIIYFSQPFWSEKLKAVELKILQELTENQIIYVKLHPSTSSDQSKNILSLKNINSITANIPAELIISELENCKLISGWSTCLMHNIGKGNEYYYLYNIFARTNDKILSQIELIEFPHIIRIDILDELFYNTKVTN